MCRSSLDKLEQLAPVGSDDLTKYASKSKEVYQKRARAKAMTRPIIAQLLSVKSPMAKAYARTLFCASVLEQRGSKVQAKYCGCRWCLVCNRIRTGKLMNGYEGIFDEFEDPQLVTLTVPNVRAKELKATIEEMTRQFSLINRNLKEKKGLRIKGLRKLETTYNAKRRDFHPHFHLMVDGKDVSIAIVGQWLRRFPKANEQAQDIREADKDTVKELFKYFTKIASKDTDFNARAMDIMFRAIKGKRIFQPYGIKRVVSEEIDEIESRVIDFKEPTSHRYWNWEDEHHDWFSLTGHLEPFCEHILSKGDRDFIEHINSP